MRWAPGTPRRPTSVIRGGRRLVTGQPEMRHIFIGPEDKLFASSEPSPPGQPQNASNAGSCHPVARLGLCWFWSEHLERF